MDNTTGPGFIPEEIIFCTTSACNLKCGHCFVNQKAGNLDTEDALKLLKDCAENGVQKTGFSGGEPFLNLDLTCLLIEESVKNEMMFDRLMTNGAWWKDETELFEKLTRVRNAGFDGKIGLSWDSFHGTSIQKAAMFITACHQVFDDETCVEILSVVDAKNKKKDDLEFTDNLIDLGLTIGGYVSGYTDKKTKNGQLAILNDYSDLCVPVYRFSQSFMPDTENPGKSRKLWKDKKWFTDDYCQATGNVLYVHADGKVAPCCGFANEEPALIIGSVKDSFSTLMKNAAENKMVSLCYCQGLENYRMELEAKEGKKALPGKTSDMCMFCAWVCKKGIVFTTLFLLACTTFAASLKIGLLNGPSAIPAANLIENNSEYDFQIFSGADTELPKLLKGEIDIGILPPNVAAKVFNASKGNIVILAVTGEGNLSLLTTKKDARNLSSLKGEKVNVAGQGATPDFMFRYILEKEDLSAANYSEFLNRTSKDAILLDFSIPPAELPAALISGKTEYILVPEPFATVALIKGKDKGVRKICSLTDEYKSVERTDSNFPMTVLVANRKAISGKEKETESFLENYRTSVEWTCSHPDEAGQLVEKHTLGLNGAIAKASIPAGAYVFVPADKAISSVEKLLQIFLDQAPESIGGKMPDLSFYYKAK